MKSIVCTLALLFATALFAQEATPAYQSDENQAQTVYTEQQPAASDQPADVAEPQPAPAEQQAAPADQQSVPIMDQALPDTTEQQPMPIPDYDDSDAQHPAVAAIVTADYVTLPGNIGTLRRDELAHAIAQ